jgi:hypothetical protein
VSENQVRTKYTRAEEKRYIQILRSASGLKLDRGILDLKIKKRTTRRARSRSIHI